MTSPSATEIRSSFSVFPADEQRERRLKRCKTRWNHVLGLVDLFAQNSKHSGCGIRFQSASGFFGNSCELTISSRTRSVVGNREWYMLDNTSRCICTTCSSLYHFSTSLFAFRMNVMPHSIRETHQSCGLVRWGCDTLSVNQKLTCQSGSMHYWKTRRKSSKCELKKFQATERTNWKCMRWKLEKWLWGKNSWIMHKLNIFSLRISWQTTQKIFISELNLKMNEKVRKQIWISKKKSFWTGLWLTTEF